MKPAIITCTYDNPITMSRECWQNGVLLCSYQSKLFAMEPFPVPPKHFFFGANVGDWHEGQLIGDKQAMERVELGLSLNLPMI